jgi:type IV secretory pathway TrbD component
MLAGPHGPGLPQFPIAPYSIANRLIFVVFAFGSGLIFGTLMGVAAWLAAAVMGRSVARSSPSPNDRFVRQR